MNNKDLNEQQIEQLVREVMPKVGRQNDRKLVDALSTMTHEELDELLAEKPKARRKPFVVALKLAAACAVLVLIIVGIERLNMGKVSHNGYASLFNTYYKEYRVSDETFSAGNDKLNKYGKANTAFIIQEASQLINKKHSRWALHRGIARLENLLERPYKPELEHEIHWYLGLAYLKDNRTNKAREEFLKVIYLKSPHSADAEKLLQQMK